MSNVKKCPKCGCEKFLVTAHVTQGWVVDGSGNFLETTSECEEVIHSPGDDDIWTCFSCGFNSDGKNFN